MQCVMCDKELNENEVVYDYVYNEYCKECLEEETKREY